jgi:hypothetical protein
MQIIQKIAAAVSITSGLLLAMPLLFTAWASRPISSTSATPGLFPTSGVQHRDVIVSIGNLSFSGWQMWTVLGAIAGFGLVLVIFGCCLLFSRESDRQK